MSLALVRSLLFIIDSIGHHKSISWITSCPGRSRPWQQSFKSRVASPLWLLTKRNNKTRGGARVAFDGHGPISALGFRLMADGSLEDPLIQQPGARHQESDAIIRESKPLALLIPTDLRNNYHSNSKESKQDFRSISIRRRDASLADKNNFSDHLSCEDDDDFQPL